MGFCATKIYEDDSSIPGAFFEFNVKNTLDRMATYTIALSLNNPLECSYNINSYKHIDNIHLIKFYSNKSEYTDLAYGDLCIATDSEDVSYQEYWKKDAEGTSLKTYWKDLTTYGRLKNRLYTDDAENVGTLAAHVSLCPGAQRKIRFVITWSFPNCYNYWKPEPENGIWKNYYVSLFKDSEISAIYSVKNWKRLFRETKRFCNALFSSTLPIEVLDAVSANISILKTPTCLRLEDGSFYGFEGCKYNEGCCEGSCSHVWNYAYALPFLFPKLERSMRDLDYKYNQREDGGMGFRLQLPLGRIRSKFSACVDGQFGGVIKSYRDWKICGDTQWLKSNWEAIKKSIEFAWAETNEDRWDVDKDGVIEGRQHHTLDRELFGANSWLTGFYLAALKAGSEMAKYLGEVEKSEEYLSLFKKGKEWVEANLFNGEFYHQLIDLKDKNILLKYNSSNYELKGKALDHYWNDEANEIKYQIGEGCQIDQVIAQWHANLCGLGEIFDKERVKIALKSIYSNNYKKNMRDSTNVFRIYTLNGEGGVVICDWPKGKYRPAVPITYADETMYGFEYQVAIHMIQEGLFGEGLAIIKEIRSRFDGEKRNPWNEYECGSNYARSMASYILLNAFSGFEFDMVSGIIGFNPIYKENNVFKTFWSLDSGWGIYQMSSVKIEIKVLYGSLSISKCILPFMAKKDVDMVEKRNKIVLCNIFDGYILFDNRVVIKKGESIIIKLK